VEDVHNLRVRTQQRYGNSLPYIMYGHSMGSFITRSYLMTHGDGLAGAIVSGTGQTPLATSRMAAFIAHVIGLFHGKNYHSPFINNLGFGAYNKAFEPVRTPFDWLSKDEKVVDIYAAEPRDTFTFTVNGYLTLFALTARIVKQGNVDLAPKDIPLLFAAGGDDPVGESGKGVWAAANQFRTAGNTHVYVRIYPGDRHEIHNELDRKQVYVDFLDWIDAVLAGNPPADNTEDPAFLGDPPADEEEGDTL